jgi:hypothetical protein
MRKRNAGILTIGLAAAAVAFTAAQRGDRSAGPGDLLVFTQIPAGDLPDLATHPFPDGARIVALDLASPGAEPELLTEGFASARSPDVHFDGHRIVFAGQREAGGPWQIWEMDLERRRARLLVPSCERCSDPVYRADDGVVFAAPVRPDGPTRAVFTVGPDGGEPERITHHPLSDGDLALVSDGRVILATGSSDPAAPATAYYAVRHDGTGAELMYRAPEGASLSGRAFEGADRALVFVERVADADETRLVTVSQAYPSSSRREVSLPGGGRPHSATPDPDGSLIVSVLEPDQTTYGLLRLAQDGATVDPVLPPAAGYHAVEPVLASPRERPLGFVSAADPAAPTGTFFGLDARLSGLGDIDSAAAVLRVVTTGGELGRVPLAPDGSFHLELPPDTPLRFETLDAEGRPVRGPSAWTWVRPGELRGCHGCHESRALAPENRIPMAATEPAVSLVPETPTETRTAGGGRP